jgi:hypothetical protein
MALMLQRKSILALPVRGWIRYFLESEVTKLVPAMLSAFVKP